MFTFNANVVSGPLADALIHLERLKAGRATMNPDIPGIPDLKELTAIADALVKWAVEFERKYLNR